MAIKAKDIAKELGISTATLSLVINGKPGISQKTRDQVLAQLKEYGYQDIIKTGSSSETAIPSSQPKTVGFILYRNGGEMLGLNSFYPLILDGVEQTARRFGYNIVVINIDRNNVQDQIKYITNANCVGFVIFATEMHGNEIECFEALNLPFVLLDNYYNNKQINSVKVNNEQATFLAVEHLYQMGHRKIGYLRSGLDINSFKERFICSDEALKAHHIDNMKDMTYTIGYPIDNAAKGMREVLKKYDKNQLPTAFLADNDLVAIGAIQAMKEAGYSIPDDFSFVGNADRPISSLIEPKLTTIKIPQDRFGSEAVFQLIQQLENHPSSYTKVEVNGELIIRDSVKDINQ